MKRKIIKQANQAYTITLPIEWVRDNGIDKKSEVDLSISERSLVISSSEKVPGRKLRFDAEDFNYRHLSRVINSIYAGGADEITVVSKKDIASDILTCLNQTIGFALVSQQKGEYVIKDIGGSGYQDLDEIFKRVFQMLLNFYESAMEDIFGKQEETLESLKLRDHEINKFCIYLQRAINKMSYPTPVKGRILFTYSFELERIGDEIERLWRTNIKYKVKKTPQLKKLIENSSEGLAMAFDFYYQFNPKIADKIVELREKVREDSMAFQKLDSHTLRFVRHVVKIIEDTSDLSHLTLMNYL